MQMHRVHIASAELSRLGLGHDAVLTAMLL